MYKLKAILMALMAAVALTLSAATTFTNGYFTYEIISSSDKLVQITGLSSTGLSTYKNASSTSAITIPGTVTYNSTAYTVYYIAPEAFKGCTKISRVYSYHGLNKIGHGAFQGCTAITQVSLPSSIEVIEYDAFRSCSSISYVFCAAYDYVPMVAANAFTGIPSSATLYVANRAGVANKYKSSSSNWPTYFSKIYRSAEACDFIKDDLRFIVTKAPNGIYSGECMLMGARAASEDFSVDIKYSYNDGYSRSYCVTEITDTCFNQVKLASYTDQRSGQIAKINKHAFFNLSKLTTVTTYCGNIGSYAFHNCSALKTVNITGPSAINSYAFNNCTALTTINLGTLTKSISSRAFYKAAATSITIPASVTEINSDAFIEMPNLATITVDDSNTTFSSYAGCLYSKDKSKLLFCPPMKTYNNSYILPVTLFHGDLQTVGPYAFYGSNATAIDLPPMVSGIGSQCFAYSKVQAVHTGGLLTQVGYNAFAHSKVYGLYFAAQTAPKLYNHDSSGFSLADQLADASQSLKIYIPRCASTIDYRNQGWVTSTSKTTAEYTEKTVDVSAEKNFGTMGYTLTEKKSYTGVSGTSYAGTACAVMRYSGNPSSTTFSGSSCKTVTVGSCTFAINKLQRYAFDNPHGQKLTTMDLRSSEFTTIADSACTDLYKLTTLYTGPVTTIGALAFDCNKYYSSNSLKTIEFTDKLKNIGANAFRGMTKITKIVLPVTALPTIGSTIFDSRLDKKNCNLRVRADMYDKFKNAAQWKDFYITDLDGNVPGSESGYELKIAGVKVTSSNCGKGAIVAGVSVTLNDTYATINMDNVNYSQNYTKFIESNYPLTGLVLSGSNKVTAASFITVTGGNVIISGNNEASLTTTASNYVTVDANFRFIANGQDQTCLILGMKSLISNGVARAFMGTAGYTTLTLSSSSGEFKSTDYSNDVIYNIKKLELYDTELTNCTYSASATKYGNNGSVKFRNTNEPTTGNKYDVNGDGNVDVGDVNTVLGDILATGGTTAKYDVNGDGHVDVGDVNAILAEILSPSGGGDVETYTVGGVSFKMIKVKGGTFTMGATSEQGSEAGSSEKPTHQVTLSDYYIGEFEVTEALWNAVMGSNPSANVKGDKYPVENVSWNDCQTFVTKLNQMTGQKFRLPTEAEWEYAARGGSKSKGYKYAGSNTLNDVAWNKDNSSSAKHSVGGKTANELGLYDMSGNIFEWVQDYKGDYPSEAVTNPTGATESDRRVQRGGSFSYDTKYCRVSARSFPYPDKQYDDSGLRLAK